MTENRRLPEEEAEFIAQNTPLVTALVGRFLSCGREFDDLFQVGMMGLLRAARNFDADRGVCFSTYAVPVILGEIRRFLRDDHPVKVSRTVKEHYWRILRAEGEYTKENGTSPTLSELSAMTDLTREEILQALEGASRPVSLETPVSGDGTLSLADTVPKTDSVDPIDSLALKEGLSRLPALERKIVTLRYFYARTQQQTADVLGLTQVQVSRKEKKIIQSLRDSMEL